MNAMEPFYEIWDVGTGNCLGTFDTEDEGLAAVSAILDANGMEFAPSLVFGLDDPNDATGDTRLPAFTGEALVERVRAWRSQQLAGAHPAG